MKKSKVLCEIGKGREIKFDNLILLRDMKKLAETYAEDRKEECKLEMNKGLYIGVESKVSGKEIKFSKNNFIVK